MPTTNFTDCYVQLVENASPYGKGKYRQWATRSDLTQVVEFVKKFTHEHLYQITSQDVAEVIASSEHALGDIHKEEQLDVVEDFFTPFAYQHLFHWFIEKNKKVPTWKEFRDWMVFDDAAAHWYVPLKHHLERYGTQFSREQWGRAAKWRLGKVYMSNIRELDLLVRLREAGLPVKYHLLADVLMRVDLWCENVLLCIYFPNRRYRSGSDGRKLSTDRFFEGNQRFKIIHFTIERQGFGTIWLANQKLILQLINQIRSEMVSI